jgi:hypothetical protein
MLSLYKDLHKIGDQGVPTGSLPIGEFLGHLAGTRNQWTIEEPD